jgi:hypothetical protein
LNYKEMVSFVVCSAVALAAVPMLAMAHDVRLQMLVFAANLRDGFQNGSCAQENPVYGMYVHHLFEPLHR